MQAAVLIAGELGLDERDRRGKIPLLQVGAGEGETRSIVAPITLGRPPQHRHRVVRASQLQQREAGQLQEPRIVGTGAEHRLERRDRLIVVARGVVRRGQLERECRIAGRERQCRFELHDRVDEAALTAGERGADDAPFSGVGELVEVLEGGEGELGGSARLPIPRFRIPAGECGGERRSVAARAKFAERLSSVTR